MSEQISIPSIRGNKDPPPRSEALPSASDTPDSMPPNVIDSDSSNPTSPPTAAPGADSKAMPPPPLPAITTRAPTESTLLNIQPQAPSSEVQSFQTADESIERKPRPPFSPFFTLINDVSDGEGSTYHPNRIHYIFSDDDASEVLTDALLRCISPAAGAESLRELQEDEGLRNSSTSSSSSATFRKDQPRKSRPSEKTPQTKKREERVIIVDVNDSGDGINKVCSLNKGWQVLNAGIENAPTWDNAKSGTEDDDNTGRGLMLKIEGIGIAGLENKEEPGIQSEGKDRQSGIGDDEIQALMEGFDKKMAILRSVLGDGERSVRESLGEAENLGVQD